MRPKEELLDAMKKNRAQRVRFLLLQDPSQLVKLIERLGHFKNVDDDIAWLEELLNSEKEGK